MDFDYRNRAAPPYRPAGAGSSFYPRVGQAAPPPIGSGRPFNQPAPPVGPGRPFNQPAPPVSSGLGIKVVLKPGYQMNSPPQLAPQMAEVPRCTFHFDFDFEKRIISEAEKGNQNWSKLVSESQPSKAAPSTSMSSTGDPLVDKYVNEGLTREAASLGVLNYGDNPVKVMEFVRGYNLLREMGFASKGIAEALSMYDNDTDKAIAHFLNASN